MFDESTGLAAGDSGYFLRTTNGGSFWNVGRMQVTGVVLFRSENLQTLDIVDQDFAVAAGTDGVAFKTLDRGVTWQSIGYPLLPEDLEIMDVKFITRDVGYVVGERVHESQNLYRTTDGGASWTQLSLAAGRTVDFVGADHGWVVNGGGPGYRTTDGGTTWTISPLPTEFSLEAVFATTTGNIWTSGFDGIVLHKAGAGSTLQLVSAVSRRSHRNAGTFDIPLPLTGTTGVECRDGGGNYSFVFTFSNNLVSGSASVTAGTGTAGTPTIAGTTMTVPLSGVTDVQTVQITLTDVTDEFSQVLPPSSVSARMLIGDATGDGEVNANDLTLTKSQVGVPVTGSNFREDVRVSGTITSADVKLVKGAQGHGVP